MTIDCRQSVPALRWKHCQMCLQQDLALARSCQDKFLEAKVVLVLMSSFLIIFSFFFFSSRFWLKSSKTFHSSCFELINEKTCALQILLARSGQGRWISYVFCFWLTFTQVRWYFWQVSFSRFATSTTSSFSLCMKLMEREILVIQLFVMRGCSL